MRPVFLDCDTGIDDSLAIGYLLASPEIHLVGVGTCNGNIDAVQAARNTLDLIALAGRTDVPVAIGAANFYKTKFEGGVPHIHGHNGIGDVTIPRGARDPEAGIDAPGLLIDLANKYNGALEVVSVGPVTNLAHALDRDPSLPGKVKKLVSMGGAALAPGNISAVAEANIGNDPEGAAKVVQADWDFTLVPLDVTMNHQLFEEDRKSLLAAPSAFSRALGEILDLYFNFYMSIYGERSCALHDPLAAAILVGGIKPSKAPIVPMVVDDTFGPGRGQTLCDMRGQRAGTFDHEGLKTRVVLETDKPLRPHLIERLLTFDAPR